MSPVQKEEAAHLHEAIDHRRSRSTNPSPFRQTTSTENMEKGPFCDDLPSNVTTPNSISAEAIAIDAAKFPCASYRVDLAASRFGQCTCGFLKGEHASSPGRGRSRSTSPTRAEDDHRPLSEKSTARVQPTGAPLNAREPKADRGETAAACENFKMDTGAPDFEQCLCGFMKSDHSPERPGTSTAKPCTNAPQEKTGTGIEGTYEHTDIKVKSSTLMSTTNNYNFPSVHVACLHSTARRYRASF